MRVELAHIHARHAAARAGSPAALQGLSLSVTAGEQLAVIGPSGAGKTTLLHIAAAALPPASGEVQLAGQSPWGISASALHTLRSALFLAPQTPPLPPRQRVVTSLLAARLPRMGLLASLKSLFYPSDIASAHAALQRFDLAERIFDRVDRLSGGERQRVGLARALLCDATLWLIDEPLSALDPNRAQQALQTLTQEAKARGVTLIATLHQVDIALAFFPRIVGLREGRVMFDLPTAQVTPAMLQTLYAQHEDELHGEAPDHTEVANPTQTVLMNCR
jgi:phosphonate transport system ATP-binding protein